MANCAPDFFTKDYLTNVVRKALARPDVQVVDFSLSPASAGGEGFICTIDRIKVTLNTKETFQLISKYTPRNEHIAEWTNVFPIFDTEVNFLAKTWPRILQQHPKANFAPRVYHVDEQNRVLFLEDCRAAGYNSKPGCMGLDHQHCLKVMETLAEIHAYTYLQLEKDPSLKQTFSDRFWRKRDNLVVDMKICVMGLEYILENIDRWEVEDELKQRLTKLRGDKVLELGYDAFTPKDSGVNVLTHGETWINNLMFKYSGEELDHVQIIDYQFASYNSIGVDINFFLFTSTDGQVQLDDLLQAYHQSFVKVAGPVLTLDKVREEFYRCMGFGFIAFYMFRPGIINMPDTFDIDAFKSGEHTPGNKKLYQSELFTQQGARLLPLFAKHNVL